MTSNDLYRHITDKHVKETDEMRPKLLAQKAEAARAVRELNAAKEASSPVKQEEEMSAIQQPQKTLQEAPETPEKQPESDDDVRYEAVTEAFLFEGQIIYPCYVILPFVNDADVEAACNPRSRVSTNDYRQIVSPYVLGLCFFCEHAVDFKNPID